MHCRITDLRCKEVINVCEGCRIGFVNDVVIDILTGHVVAIVIPGKCRFFGLFGRLDDFVVPWDCIRRIGDDIILVDIELERIRTPRERRGWF